MNHGVAILAALGLAAFTGASAAAQTSQSFVIKVPHQIGMYPPQGPLTPWPRFVDYHSYGLYPVACEAVIYPRTPLCAGGTASFGPYAAYPWNLYLYY